MENLKNFILRIKNLTRKEKTKEHLKRIKQIQVELTKKYTNE